MTFRAIVGPRGELVGMRVLMTIAAIDGRFGEVNMPHAQLHRRRLVAVDTGYGAMCSFEWEVSLCVIKACQIVPLAGRMASLAAESLSRSIMCRHTLRELASMHIFVAGRAVEVGEVIRRYFRTGHGLVAVIAGHRDMASGKWEAGLLVLGECVVCRLKGRPCMALLASVPPRRARKLPLVFIGVAIHALRELDFELRILARGHVALGTLHTGVREDQREPSLRVVGGGEGGWTPSLDRVTTLALSAIGAEHKLASMGIGLVAIRACIVWNRGLEVGPLVTTFAGNFKVLADQRVIGLRVIEGCCEIRFFPRECCVARIASLSELSLVRIAMTIGTVGERQPCIADLSVGAGRVATRTEHVAMFAGQRITGLGVIERLAVDGR